jgi:23S rRNA pseudouridine955/2504/2580 synthase
MAEVRLETVAADEDGMRLDRWFKARYPALGFGQLAKLVRTGQVRVDGARAKTSTRLAAGQNVRIPPIAPDPAGTGSVPRGEAGMDASALAGAILYEDDAVIVFDKPAGLAVQGGSGLSRHVDGMLAAFTDRRGQRPRLVHRLDRDTSGVLVVARTRAAAAALAAVFRDRRTRKIYWALVKGMPKPRQGRIATLLARGEGEDVERMEVTETSGAETRRAVTLYSVVDHAAQRFAWLSLRPVTGRTHQLRVHTAHIGHPIIGDPKYFDIENWELPGGMQNKLHLHARRLVLPHPSGAGTLDVTAPLPPHMRQSWSVLGFDDRYRDDETDDGA